MSDPTIDDIDRTILRALVEDARHNTNADISERVNVSASTVSKRIRRLEDRGVVEGYRAGLDYEQLGLPLSVLFVCTAPIPEREDLVERTLEIDGVVDVRELMTGDGNVHVKAVGASNDDVTRTAGAIDELGYAVSDVYLLRAEHEQPSISLDVPAVDD